jgi:hypothetical protein
MRTTSLVRLIERDSELNHVIGRHTLGVALQDAATGEQLQELWCRTGNEEARWLLVVDAGQARRRLVGGQMGHGIGCLLEGSSPHHVGPTHFLSHFVHAGFRAAGESLTDGFFS